MLFPEKYWVRQLAIRLPACPHKQQAEENLQETFPSLDEQ